MLEVLRGAIIVIRSVIKDGGQMNKAATDITEDQWKDRLTAEEYRIMREKGTEAPFTGKYVNNHSDGAYHCKACNQVLFASDTKFDSGSGWPSFTEPVNLMHVELISDNSLGVRRVEVACKQCGSHLGHVFDDGPIDKGGQRYCINSACLQFEKNN